MRALMIGSFGINEGFNLFSVGSLKEGWMIAIKVWRGTLVTLVRQVHFLFLFEQQRNKDKQSSSPLVQYENACDGWD